MTVKFKEHIYLLDNYKNPISNEESNEESNLSPSDPKQHDSHIDEVTIKHDQQLASSPIPIYIITNVFNQIQLIAPFVQGCQAYNSFYLVDDGSCKVCEFKLYFETKGQAKSTQEISQIPDVIFPADGKRIFSKLKKLSQVVGKGVSWMNDKIVKLIMPITNALLSSLGPAGSMVAKGISARSSAVDALFWQKVPIDIISKRIQLLGDELQ
ncbi:MAG: hypothetical protein EZS28_022962 [Streblomastix strix]|uniref:Uncharacterized protein n=1 Tax=Streblomastix strix TaxID=222440 RepID=A0A5J4VG69_9EUKA|nr:MAG: hypothetical protein EZS28_022962 [Streblomastix strix]